MAENSLSIFIHDGIGPVLDLAAVTAVGKVTEAMRQGVEEVEAYAKANAPWTDQTGAARNGLTADVQEEDGEIILSLFHTVDYGVWLETIQDGAYAIIMPTLEELGPQIIKDAGGQVLNIGYGDLL